MEKGESAESSQSLTIRPIVLPPIPTSLRAAWNVNAEKLRQAGIFNYLAWIQSVTRVAYTDRVFQFVQTCSKELATAQVDGRTIDFSVKMIERTLRLPGEGKLVEDLDTLTKNQFASLFEGDSARTPKGCRLDAAKPQWKPWLKFVNDYLLFRPQKDTMTQKMIVAAMMTWDGKKVHWAQAVQQKMLEEIAAKCSVETKKIELYSAFYISVLCEQLPPPAVFLGGPSSPRLTPSPLSSPEKPVEDDAENRKLKIRVQDLQAMVDEKQDQLIKKGEALVESQTNSVKNLRELAQTMKEKMDCVMEMEALRRATEANKVQIEAKEMENRALKLQLQVQEPLQLRLSESQEKLKNTKAENLQLREKLRVQQEDLDKQKEMLSKKKEEQLPVIHDPSTSLPVLFSSFPSETIAQLWKWESSCPTSQSLFQLYEVQRDLFLMIHQLVRSDWLDHSLFVKIWQDSKERGVENLFTEILARKHIQLSDPHAAFLLIGDMGARILLYYASLEEQWVIRQNMSVKDDRRVVNWQDYSTRVSSQFYAQNQSDLYEWQQVLSELHKQLEHSEFTSRLLIHNTRRLSIVQSAELNASHYLFQYEKTVNRLERYLKEAAARKRPLLNLHGQIQLDLPPPGFSTSNVTLTVPLLGSPLTLQYLGQYPKMFNDPQEMPVPTWQAIAWLLEDYGLSRTEDVPADIHYRRISRQWSSSPPPAITNHPQFCACPRRNKWDPQATLHSVEYNWPLIPGSKTTAANCQATYRSFFKEHIQHLDPVCFRAAVFCNTLAEWCSQWNVTIDVNHFSESHHEFLLLLKLQYRPTRWVRMVEAMALTHFIAGAHKCLINEFPHTRAGPFERFLRWQRHNAPGVVEQDDDLRRAIEKLETRDNKRATECTTPPFQPPQKFFRR